jgi:hypothetical protein
MGCASVLLKRAVKAISKNIKTGVLFSMNQKVR